MEIKAEKVEQITLSLENRQGILADLCAHLRDHRINIRAMTALESGDAGSVLLVVDNPEQAKNSLDEAGVVFTCSHCLAVEMPNHPGGFAHIAHTLSLAGINISLIYASATGSAGRALGIFGVSDLEKALTLDWN